MSEARESNARAIAAYKKVLREALDKRPSGTRLKLAAALGTNRSFISQITNPGYLIPIPAQHIELIFEICHLAVREREAFLEAYHAAHPGRVANLGRHSASRSLTVNLPDLGDERRNRALDKAVLEFAARLVGFAREVGSSPMPGENEPPLSGAASRKGAVP